MFDVNSRYNGKKFLEHMRKVSPKAYIQYLKDTKGNGQNQIYYKDCNKLHIRIKVKRGITSYSMYYRDGNLIDKGVEK